MSPKIKYQLIANELPLFFKPWWLDAVCNNGWDVVILEEDEKIIAVWPYQLEQKMGFSIIRNPLLTPYLGPYVIDQTQQLNTQQFLLLKGQLPKCDTLHWALYPEMLVADFWTSESIVCLPKRTYLLSLQASNALLWSKINPKKRNAIKKAEKDLEVTKEAIDIPQFIAWQSIAFEEKNKKYPYNATLFQKIFKHAKEQKAGLSYTAKDADGNCLAQIWLAKDQNRIYYLLSATPAKTHRGSIALLLWHAIQDAQDLGLSIFDFEGSSDPGIEHLFKGFGGDRVDYQEQSITLSKLWKLKLKLLG
ncbi:MAG: GNAT family N-acetyltransferase [Chitinophagaceae bacterium]|nr:GNAT family N-acetyltransferase [Chitinophagaceae bacterium]